MHLQLDNWFKLEVTVIWERVALHASVALQSATLIKVDVKMRDAHRMRHLAFFGSSNSSWESIVRTRNVAHSEVAMRSRNATFADKAI
jgi:hypothetical protein